MTRHTAPLLALALTVPLHAASTDPAKPNIILFIVDDMGWQDTSVPMWHDAEGKAKPTFLNERYRTPNMEALANDGMIFSRAYACPISSPTRTSLMTGMNAARHRVTNWTLNPDKSTDSAHPSMTMPDWNLNGLQPRGTKAKGRTKEAITGDTVQYDMSRPFIASTTFPQILQKKYTTIHVGKAHWGAKGTPGANPLNLGFDYNIAGCEIGGPADYRGSKQYGTGGFKVRGLDENRFHDEDVFLSEALTIKALELLNELKEDPKEKNKPFYLYMAHYAIHVPLDARAVDKRFVNNYSNPNDGHGWSEYERNYSGLIEGMDKSLGDLMNWLKENKLDENTIIIFMSDNGGYVLDQRIKNGNYPLRYGKGSCYEGGLRVPMIVKWPNVVKPKSVSTTPVIIEDFYPSILEMASMGSGKTKDAVSFVPQLKGEKMKARPLLFHVPNTWIPGSGAEGAYGPMSALVDGDWKLLFRHVNEKYELYNLADDIGETKDLAESNPKQLAAMKATMKKLMRERKAQMPKKK